MVEKSLGTKLAATMVEKKRIFDATFKLNIQNRLGEGFRVRVRVNNSLMKASVGGRNV